MVDYNQENEEQEENEMYEHYRLSVDPGQSPLRIDKFLSNRLDNASRSRIQAAADAGNIRVNGIPVKPNYKIKPNEEILIVMDFPRRELKIIPEEIPLNIVYEDDQLIVINKPPGLVVHPGHGNYTGTLVNALAWYFKDLPLFNSEDPRPGLVHRIDKDTSGLLVVAKTEMAKNKLALQFFEKTTERRYHALVWGSVKEDEGTITGNIGRSLKNRQVFTVFPENDYGKHAVTHYKVLRRIGYVSLVECRLETGRTHQIRVHMKHLNHPIFNDSNYGGDQILRGTTFSKYRQFVQNCFKVLPRQALHAKTLGFIHPTSGEKMLFNSELPEDMATGIDKWENYIANRNE
ncbi:RluA family pseudouridine synthase [Draconibacterium halophilum]|uniref:Pseudouridine synthase n=1 Tax=Draconibacterium halophilum TaxID=2706887 RepID=A0A6C0RBA9_9BACT|nr:RluA family pseudouridine synthase [Draconibacterium halophilum]QIA07306.1 RluA family pseudouridine synthase [Draconibacterium halophilum]